MSDKSPEPDALALVALAFLDCRGCSKPAAFAAAAEIPDDVRREIAAANRPRRPALLLEYLRQQAATPTGTIKEKPPRRNGGKST